MMYRIREIQCAEMQKWCKISMYEIESPLLMEYWNTFYKSIAIIIDRNVEQCATLTILCDYFVLNSTVDSHAAYWQWLSVIASIQLHCVRFELCVCWFHCFKFQVVLLDRLPQLKSTRVSNNGMKQYTIPVLLIKICLQIRSIWSRNHVIKWFNSGLNIHRMRNRMD